MDDDLDTLGNPRLRATPSRDIKGSSKFNSLRKLRFPRFSSTWTMPKIGIPRFRSNQLDGSTRKNNFLWLWLIVILISYAFIGYFLSVLLTMPSRKELAIAGFAFIGLLPTITAFADYALMKWSYLLSGFLIVGGLIFLANVKFHFIFLAIMLWIGITTIAFVGESLIKQNRKFFVAIIILTFPCLLGLLAGWQVWQFVATKFS